MDSLKQKIEDEIIVSDLVDAETKTDTVIELANALERIAIEDKIKSLIELCKKLKLQSKSLKESLKPNSMSNNRIEGKCSGLKIAIESIEQEIQSFESQLNEKVKWKC